MSDEQTKGPKSERGGLQPLFEIDDLELDPVPGAPRGRFFVRRARGSAGWKWESATWLFRVGLLAVVAGVGYAGFRGYQYVKGPAIMVECADPSVSALAHVAHGVGVGLEKLSGTDGLRAVRGRAVLRGDSVSAALLVVDERVLAYLLRTDDSAILWTPTTEDSPCVGLNAFGLGGPQEIRVRPFGSRPIKTPADWRGSALTIETWNGADWLVLERRLR